MRNHKDKKRTLQIRESTQGRTTLVRGCFRRMGLDLIGECMAVSHWMVAKFVGLPWLEVVQSPGIRKNLLGCRRAEADGQEHRGSQGIWSSLTGKMVHSLWSMVSICVGTAIGNSLCGTSEPRVKAHSGYPKGAGAPLGAWGVYWTSVTSGGSFLASHWAWTRLQDHWAMVQAPHPTRAE